MPRFEFCKKFLGGPHLSLSRVVDALPDSFACICPRCNVEQPLISFCVLYDGRCFTLHGKHDRPFGLFKLFYEVA